MSLSTVLSLQYSDGVIEFRDRTSLEVLARDDYLTQVSSLSQVGFEFSDAGLCTYFLTFHWILVGVLEKESNFSNSLGLHSALSPNACAVVSLGQNHEVKLSLMQMSIGGFDEQADRGLSNTFIQHGRRHSLTLQQHWLKQQQWHLFVNMQLLAPVTDTTTTS